MHEETNPAPRPVPGPPPGTAGRAPQEQEPFEPADVAAEAASDVDPRAGIEEAIAGLDQLDYLPPAQHVERFDAVHTELAVALSSIDKV